MCAHLFPRSLIAESEFYTGIKGGSKNMMIDLVKMLRNVFFVPVTADEYDINWITQPGSARPELGKRRTCLSDDRMKV